jgi:hypothetical protein
MSLARRTLWVPPPPLVGASIGGATAAAAAAAAAAAPAVAEEVLAITPAGLPPPAPPSSAARIMAGRLPEKLRASSLSMGAGVLVPECDDGPYAPAVGVGDPDVATAAASAVGVSMRGLIVPCEPARGLGLSGLDADAADSGCRACPAEGAGLAPGGGVLAAAVAMATTAIAAAARARCVAGSAWVLPGAGADDGPAAMLGVDVGLSCAHAP